MSVVWRKDVLYDEIALPCALCNVDHLQAIQSAQLGIQFCDCVAADSNWRYAVRSCIRKAEKTNCERRRKNVGEKDHRLPRQYIKLSTPVTEIAKIGLLSHSRYCAKQ